MTKKVRSNVRNHESSKLDYVLRSLSKIRSKRWEHYVVNRIYHLLGDPQIDFVCQQAFRNSKSSNVYLADLFFPQIKIYLEIDEGYHDSDEVKIKDAVRRLDIAEATGFEEVRIRVSDFPGLIEMDAQIAIFVEKVRERKEDAIESGTFKAWDYERRFDPRRHIEAGFIEVGPDAAFRTHRQALACFGYDKGDYQRAVWKLPNATVQALGEAGEWCLWFPKLYKNKLWANSISDDGTLIKEIPNTDRSYVAGGQKRIVMAHGRDELNRTLYRFVGVFEVLPEFTGRNEHRYCRLQTTLRTFGSK